MSWFTRFWPWSRPRRPYRVLCGDPPADPDSIPFCAALVAVEVDVRGRADFPAIRPLAHANMERIVRYSRLLAVSAAVLMLDAETQDELVAGLSAVQGAARLLAIHQETRARVKRMRAQNGADCADEDE